jgi:osmotically inducible protein OsmC
MPTRRASAAWEGGLRGGKGSYKTASGLVGGTYGFGSRFEETPGSNPEELLAAAHAACLSMALSGRLERGGHVPTRVATDAACTVEKVGDAFKITKMQLVVRAKVPGMDQAAFAAAAEAALAGCPVSGALKGNVAFELDAKLE